MSQSIETPKTPKIPIGFKTSTPLKTPQSETPVVSSSVPAQGKYFLDKPLEHYAWTEEGIYKDPSGEVYLLPNNKKFGSWINKKYAKYKATDNLGSCEVSKETGEKPPFPHQLFVRDYMSMRSPARGLLLNQGLGSGKTRATVITTEPYRKAGVRILLMMPATLKTTWLNELKTWGDADIRRPDNYETLSALERANIDAILDKKIYEGYDFVSYNASNTLDQLKKATGGELKHRFIVVEEVHNLISMMVNPKGKKGLKLYQALMDAIDCKFMFLSATPLLNTPFELGILFNILKGYMTFKGTKYTLFPETELQFEEYFIDYETKKIRNPELFKKRILGLVSYYYGAKGDVYPDLILNPPTEIEFSDYQFSKYAEVRSEELSKESKAPKGDKKQLADLSGAKGKGSSKYVSQKDQVSSTFRIFSRQFSNYVFPEKIKRPMPRQYADIVKSHLPTDPKKWTPEQAQEISDLFDGDQAQINQFIATYQSKALLSDAERLKYLQEVLATQGKDIGEFSNITNDEEQFIMDNLSVIKGYDDAIENSLKLLDKKRDIYFKELLPCLGPKMERIYHNLMEGEGSDGPGFVYSQFRMLEGINIFSRVLETHGFEALPYNEITPANIKDYVGKLRYVIYSGEEDTATRNKILWIFNHPLNMNGQIAKVFLGTAAAAEGLTLKNTRQVHILEPYWNEVRMEQVIGRARRICSHAGLPKSKRKVYVYRYHMILTKKQQAKIGEDLSTDQAVYQIALTKKQINSQFLQILKDAAVDCVLNASQNITADNPIVCFSFDESETGVAYFPNLSTEKSDDLFLIHYAQKSANYAVFNLYGSSDLRFYAEGDYLYVYKYADNPKIIKKEKIMIPSKGNKVIPAIVLYDKVLAQKGNMFVHKKAIVEDKIIPAQFFEVID